MAERTITAFTFSKTYAMTLARRIRGGQRALHDRAAQNRALLHQRGRHAVQYAMIQALTTPESEIARLREEYRKRRDLLVAVSMKWALNACRPQVRSMHSQRGKDSQEQPHSRADSS